MEIETRCLRNTRRVRACVRLFECGYHRVSRARTITAPRLNVRLARALIDYRDYFPQDKKLIIDQPAD